MIRKHRRYFLKEKESKELLERASQRLKLNLKQIFQGKASLEVIETEFGKVCLADGKAVLVVTEKVVYPTLISEELFRMLPKVTVDMGAIPFICKGANIMAPGIRGFEGSFSKGDLVFVVDEKHGKPLALGEVIYDIEEAKNVKQGKIVENIHYVGDNLWEFIRNFANKTK